MPFDKKPHSSASGILFFLAGIAVALAFGWFGYSALLYSKQEQPVQFSHAIHMSNTVLTCSVCHYYREDGTFSGLPTLTECSSCHAQAIGSSREEQNFILEYIEQGKEVAWIVYQKQPGYVYFSHMAHSLDTCNACHNFSEKELCFQCHIDVTSKPLPPVFYQNRLTGYSKDTMLMEQCKTCHKKPEHVRVVNTDDACFVCHK